MKLRSLAAGIGARILAPGQEGDIEIGTVYGGDRMSDLLHAVSDSTLLVTHVSNQGLVRLIELMDVPAVCLLDGAAPEQGVLDAAMACGTAVLVSPSGMFETCGRLYRILCPLAGETTGL